MREPRSTVEEKERWLAAHPELQGKPKVVIVRAMKKAGLIASSTYAADVAISREDQRKRKGKNGEGELA